MSLVSTNNMGRLRRPKNKKQLGYCSTENYTSVEGVASDAHLIEYRLVNPEKTYLELFIIDLSPSTFLSGLS